MEDVRIDAVVVQKIGRPTPNILMSFAQLERDVNRPVLSDERVQFDPAAQVELKLKTPWKDGTTQLVMRPLDFAQQLATRSRPRQRSCRTLSPFLGRTMAFEFPIPRSHGRVVRQHGGTNAAVTGDATGPVEYRFTADPELLSGTVGTHARHDQIQKWLARGNVLLQFLEPDRVPVCAGVDFCMGVWSWAAVAQQLQCRSGSSRDFARGIQLPEPVGGEFCQTAVAGLALLQRRCTFLHDAVESICLAAENSYRDTLKIWSVESLATSVAVMPSLLSVILKLAIPLPPVSLAPKQPLVSTETLSTLNSLLVALYE